MRGYPDAITLLEIAESANVPKTPSEEDWGQSPTFDAHDGWKVVVFYDCDSLDNIEHFISPDGQVIDFWTWDERNPDRRILMAWSGNGDLARLRPYLDAPDEERVARELCWLTGQDPDNGATHTWRDFVEPAKAWLSGATPLVPTAF